MIGTGPFKLRVRSTRPPVTSRSSRTPTTGARASPTSTASTSSRRRTARSASAASQGGEFDITHDAGGLDLDADQEHDAESPRSRTSPTAGWRSRTRCSNVTRPPLDDLNARKAVALAVDREPAQRDREQGHEPPRQPDLRHRRAWVTSHDLKLPDAEHRRGEEAGQAVQGRARRQVRVRDPVDVRHHRPSSSFQEVKRELAAGRHHGEPAEPGRPGDDHQPGHRWPGRRLRLAQLPRPGPGHASTCGSTAARS